jgi:hypothetical protein
MGNIGTVRQRAVAAGIVCSLYLWVSRLGRTLSIPSEISAGVTYAAPHVTAKDMCFLQEALNGSHVSGSDQATVLRAPNSDKGVSLSM